MKEVQEIITAFQNLRPKERAVLATVVETSGSVYRCAGAQMLILSSGQQVGSISGGCLERDVRERALEGIGSPAQIVVYDARSDEDLLWGLGLGCNGVVKVLMETLTAGAETLISFIADCRQQNHSGIIATVYESELPEVAVGSRLTLDGNGLVNGNFQNEQLLEKVLAEARAVQRIQRSANQKHAFASGNVAIRIELIQPPFSLMVFGAGQDAVPVVQFGKVLGWNVTVCDRRIAGENSARFSVADRRLALKPQEALDCLGVGARTAAVIMSHHYFDDLESLRALALAPVEYIGLLGPKQRTQKLLSELAAEGIRTDHLKHLYAPVGLDIGAETPEAIALAILAEIQAVFANRGGGMLRDRQAPIHSHSESGELRRCLVSG
jgi:xanthine dehydrogenase accessory factor